MGARACMRMALKGARMVPDHGKNTVINQYLRFACCECDRSKGAMRTACASDRIHACAVLRVWVSSSVVDTAPRATGDDPTVHPCAAIVCRRPGLRGASAEALGGLL